MLFLSTPLFNFHRPSTNKISDLDGEIAKEVGLVLAKRRDGLLKACKGKTEALLPKEETPEVEENVDA